MTDDDIFLFSTNRFDDAVTKLLVRVTRSYCKLTGRDNFSLARGTLIASLLCAWAYLAACALRNTSWVGLLGPLVIFPMFHFNAWVSFEKIKRLRQIAEALREGHMLSMMDVFAMESAARGRQIDLTVAPVYVAILGTVAIAIADTDRVISKHTTDPKNPHPLTSVIEAAVVGSAYQVSEQAVFDGWYYLARYDALRKPRDPVGGPDGWKTMKIEEAE